MTKINSEIENNQLVPYSVDIVPTNLCMRYYRTTFKISNMQYKVFQAPFNLRSIGEIGKIGSSMVHAISKIAGIKRICILEYSLKIDISDYFKWCDIEPKVIDTIVKFAPK